MDITVSVTRIGPGDRDLRVNVFQDSPVWQSAGRTLDGITADEVLRVLRALGIPNADSDELLRSAMQAQFSARRRQLRLSAEQQTYRDRTFPPL
jgi:hypothetical protein